MNFFRLANSITSPQTVGLGVKSGYSQNLAAKPQNFTHTPTVSTLGLLPKDQIPSLTEGFSRSMSSFLNEIKRQPAKVPEILKSMKQALESAKEKAEQISDEMTKLEVQKKTIETSFEIGKIFYEQGMKFAEEEEKLVLSLVKEPGFELIELGMDSYFISQFQKKLKSLKEENQELMDKVVTASGQEKIKLQSKILKLQKEISDVEKEVKDRKKNICFTCVHLVNDVYEDGSLILTETDLFSFSKEAIEEILLVGTGIDLAVQVLFTCINYKNASSLQEEMVLLTKEIREEKEKHAKLDPNSSFAKIVQARINSLERKLFNKKESLGKRILKLGTGTIGGSISAAKVFLAIAGVTIGTTGTSILAGTGVGLGAIGSMLLIYTIGKKSYKHRHDIRYLGFKSAKAIEGKWNHQQKNKELTNQHQSAQKLDEVKREEEELHLFTKATEEIEKTGSLKKYILPSSNQTQIDEVWQKKKEEIAKRLTVTTQQHSDIDKRIQDTQKKIENYEKKEEQRRKDLEKAKNEKITGKLADKFYTFTREDLKILKIEIEKGLQEDDFKNEIAKKLKLHPTEIDEKTVYEYILS